MEIKAYLARVEQLIIVNISQHNLLLVFKVIICYTLLEALFDRQALDMISFFFTQEIFDLCL